MQDFTLTTYKALLQELSASGYLFQILQGFIQQPEDKIVILRHDVDRKPENALAIAKVENEAGIKASYYFRILKESCDENIIKKIAEMGHEIGYHYENLTTCGGDLRLSIDDFRLNLKKLRKFYPVKTICMHGSPLSKFDNRLLWNKYDYRDLGIIAEPYFDIDFDEVLYLTDTGRCWDGARFSIRDKVEKTEVRDPQITQITRIRRKGTDVGNLRFRHTWDIIEAAEKGLLPDKIMINVHPQRWTDRPLPWVKELILQSIKNCIKSIIVKRRDRSFNKSLL